MEFNRFYLSLKLNDSTYIADVYDELLTQVEIQGYINKINGLFVFFLNKKIITITIFPNFSS